MLQVFRKHATSWLIKVAFFIIVVVFVFWGGYSYKTRQQGQVARIGDHYISNREYEDSYRQLMEMYKRQFGPSFNEETVKKLGVNIKQQALDGLIERYVMLDAAMKMGFVPTVTEIQQKVLSYPIFLNEGKFDRQRYSFILRQNHMTPEVFEQQLGNDMAIQKLQAFVKRRAVVTEGDIQADFQYNHAQVQLEYIPFSPKSYEDQVTMDDKAIQSFFQEKKDRYKGPEKRQIAYVLFSPEAYTANVKISDEEIRQYYEENEADFHEPPTVKARHILFAVKEDAPEEEVSKMKAEAQKVLDQAKQGKDFAELAKQYSKDPGSAGQGGDLGYFRKEQMVGPFAEAAFAMKPGEISDLVRSPYGFHIIKVEDTKPERTVSFEEARSKIETELREQKARDVAFNKAKDFSNAAYAQKDVGKAAQFQNLTVAGGDKWVVEKDSLPGLENTPPATMKKLFGFTEKEVSDVLEFAQGFVVAQVQGIQAPQVPAFEEVKDRVEKDFKMEQSRVLAQKKASEFLEAARKSGSIESAAKESKLDSRKSEWFSRSKPDKDLQLLRGDSMDAVFQADVSKPFPGAPVELGDRFVVFQLLGKKVPTDDLAKERTAIEQKLGRQKEVSIWMSWLDQQRKKMEEERFREL